MAHLQILWEPIRCHDMGVNLTIGKTYQKPLFHEDLADPSDPPAGPRRTSVYDRKSPRGYFLDIRSVISPHPHAPPHPFPLHLYSLYSYQ